MGKFKTKEQRDKKKMEKNPGKYSSGLSGIPEGDPTPKVEYTEEQKELIKKGATEERQRLLAAVFSNKEFLTAEYKVLIKKTGGLLTASMCVAYSRAFNDIIKLMIKEIPKDEKSI